MQNSLVATTLNCHFLSIITCQIPVHSSKQARLDTHVKEEGKGLTPHMQEEGEEAPVESRVVHSGGWWHEDEGGTVGDGGMHRAPV